MRRGEIRLVSLDPAVGAESANRRPAVIVSNNGANSAAARRGRGVVTMVPLTSNVANVLSFQVLVPASESGLDRDSKAQAEQVRAVDVARVGACVGAIPLAVMKAIDAALVLHLGL